MPSAKHPEQVIQVHHLHSVSATYGIGAAMDRGCSGDVLTALRS